MNKPPRTYSVDIPTKTYLRKYVHAVYGNPVQLKYNTNLGILVLCLLEKDHFTVDMNKEKMDVRLSYMNDKIGIITPLSKMQKRGFSLTNNKIIAINRFIETEFQQELYKYCRDNKQDRSWRPGIDKSIHAFAEQFGILVDIDITFEALKKAEYRYRKNLQEKLATFVPPPSRPSSSMGLRFQFA
jgi:hypothetical protein